MAPPVNLDLALLSQGSSIPCGTSINYSDASRQILRRICFIDGKTFPTTTEKATHTRSRHKRGNRRKQCSVCYEFIPHGSDQYHNIEVLAHINLDNILPAAPAAGPAGQVANEEVEAGAGRGAVEAGAGRGAGAAGAGRLAGRLAGRAAGRLAGRLAGRAAGRLAGRLAGRAAGRLAGRAAGRLAGRAAGRGAFRAAGGGEGRGAGRAAGRATGRGFDDSGHGMSLPMPSQGGVGGQRISQPPRHDPQPAQPPQQGPPPVWPPWQVPHEGVPVVPDASSSEERARNYIPDTPAGQVGVEAGQVGVVEAGQVGVVEAGQVGVVEAEQVGVEAGQVIVEAGHVEIVEAGQVEVVEAGQVEVVGAGQVGVGAVPAGAGWGAGGRGGRGMNGFHPPVYITYEVPCKLHHYNFLAWKMEVSRVIDFLGLKGYIDGSNPSPPVRVLSTEGRTVWNPSYINWFMQDQLLLGWLRSMVYPPVLAMLILSRSSATFWKNLHTYYRENPSLAEVVNLQKWLLNFERGIQSCSMYCKKMKAFADKLSSLGAPVSDAELVTAIASKLGPDFEPFSQYIQCIPDGPPSFEQFYAMLLAFESTL